MLKDPLDLKILALLCCFIAFNLVSSISEERGVCRVLGTAGYHSSKRDQTLQKVDALTIQGPMPLTIAKNSAPKSSFSMRL